MPCHKNYSTSPFADGGHLEANQTENDDEEARLLGPLSPTHSRSSFESAQLLDHRSAPQRDYYSTNSKFPGKLSVPSGSPRNLRGPPRTSEGKLFTRRRKSSAGASSRPPRGSFFRSPAPTAAASATRASRATRGSASASASVSASAVHGTPATEPPLPLHSTTPQFATPGLVDESYPLLSHRADSAFFPDLYPSDTDYPAEYPDSKPSSRRSSETSSLDDVCFPVDTSGPLDGSGPHRKQWPDIAVLQQFADEERAELEEILRLEAAAAGKPGPSGSESQMAGSYTSGSSFGAREVSFRGGGGAGEDSGGSGGAGGAAGHSASLSLLRNTRVNETEMISGKLRPQPFNPWAGQNQRNHKQLTAAQLGQLGPDDRNPLQYRFTYFREDLDSTIHSQTISGLVQPGQSFSELFPPSVDESGGVGGAAAPHSGNSATTSAAPSAAPSEAASSSVTLPGAPGVHVPATGVSGPTPLRQVVQADGSTSRFSPDPETGGPGSSVPPPDVPLPQTHQERSPFWLDVLNPTEEEMKVLAKTFGMHPLTTEDIFLGETREKVELFKHYYLVCFRSFDVRPGGGAESGAEGGAGGVGGVGGVGGANGMSTNPLLTSLLRRRWSNGGRSDSSGSQTKRKSRRRKKESELVPLNMYILVFHDGVLTFHFAPTAHPINVRRRARMLRDYLTVTSDWISYALIDDITDAFAPLIESIEEEVNAIEDAILRLNDSDSDAESDTESDNGSVRFRERKSEKSSGYSRTSRSSSTGGSDLSSNEFEWRQKGDMLRRIGECRKRVMSVLRLLGSKADVIKGFAKRYSEHWDSAPRSEIGMYLGDIQDHIVTMVQSLNHYEKLLARSHSNYLAQINIDMTKVNNDMNDVLGKISIMGTVVLPMNIVTGLWGMNVIVPGQEHPGLIWFMSIFGIICYFYMAKYYMK